MFDDNSIGYRLKLLRLSKGMTAKQVANELGVSAAYVSMLEKGKSNYNLKLLLKLMDIYGETLSDFLQAPKNNGRVRHLADMRQLAYDNPTMDYRLIRSEGDPDIFRPYYFHLQPGGDTEMSKHGGTEYLIVVEGTVVVTLINPDSGEMERYQLQQWDSIYYSSSWLHGTKNESDSSSRFILVYSPYVETDGKLQRAVEHEKTTTSSAKPK